MSAKLRRKSLRYGKVAAVCAAVVCAFGVLGGELDASKFAHETVIAFGGYEGASTLTNFPALVKIAEGVGGFSYADCAQANGGDVRFSDGRGNELPSEVAEWNASGTSAFWVKVPELSKTALVYMHWGNAAVGRRDVAARVFDETFTGVYHLEETGRSMYDASHTGAHGLAANASGENEGVVGRARKYTAENATYGNPFANPVKGSSFTLECWFKADAAPAGDTPMLIYGRPNKPYMAYNCGIAFMLNSAGKPVCYLGDYATTQPRFTAAPGEAVALGEWHYLNMAFMHGGDSQKCAVEAYCDGVKFADNANVDFVWNDAYPHQLWTGYSEYTHKRTFSGQLDEIRVSEGVRGADYARAVFMNVASNDLFMTVSAMGAEDVIPSPAPTVARKVRLTVSAGVGGTVSPAGETWVDEGTVVTIAATAADGTKGFHSWTGDVPELEKFSPTFKLRVTKPTELEAVFGKAYYLKPATEGGDDAQDGLSLATAKETFIDAVKTMNASAENFPAVLFVTPGEYTFTNVVRTYPCTPENQLKSYACFLTNAVAVRATEKHKAVLNFQKRDNCLCFYMKNEGALLEGLVMSNAYSSGYADCYDALVYRGYIKDCKIGWSSMAPYAEASDVHMMRGWIRDTEFVKWKRNDTGATATGAPLVLTGGIVDGCTFRDNSDATSALAVSAGANRAPGGPAGECESPCGVIRNSFFINNSSFGNGGAINVSRSADYCGGAIVENCTFVNNTATKYGGAVYGDGANLVNCAFLDNTADQVAWGMDYYGAGCLGVLSAYVDSSDGCIPGIPSYKDAATGDYSTKGVSLTRDNGLWLSWAYAPDKTDMNGNARVDGETIDIGAAEYVPSGNEPLEVNASADVLSGVDTLTARFMALVSGAADVTYAWDFGDGGVSSEASPSHTYSKGGYYTVTLVVTDAKDPTKSATFTQEAMIKVLPTTCYVRSSKGETWTPVPPYVSYETAADSLQAAFALGTARIELGEGEIALGGKELSITRNVVIHGQGQEVSKLNLDGYWIVLNCEDAVLSGFTVYNSYSSNKHGAIDFTSGMMTNCMVRSPKNANDYSCALRMKGPGRFIRSTVCNYTKGYQSDWGMAVTVETGSGALFEGCFFTNLVQKNTGNNNSMQGAVVANVSGNQTVFRNCLVANCRAEKKVGVLGMKVSGNVLIENCTVAGNVANSTADCAGVSLGNGARMVNTLVATNTCMQTVLDEQGVETNVVVVSNFMHGDTAEYEDLGNFWEGDPKLNLGQSSKLPYWGILGSSPCRNAGKKATWMEGAVDLSGKARVFGGKPDIGCYESQVGGFALKVR